MFYFLTEKSYNINAEKEKLNEFLILCCVLIAGVWRKKIKLKHKLIGSSSSSSSSFHVLETFSPDFALEQSASKGIVCVPYLMGEDVAELSDLPKTHPNHSRHFGQTNLKSCAGKIAAEYL